MNTNLILTLLLAVGFIALFYRLVTRPLIADLINQRMYAQEKNLERMVKRGEIKSDDFCYQFVCKQLKVRHILRTVSVSNFIHFMVMNNWGEKLNASDVKQFLTDSSPELRKIYSEHGKDFALWIAVNSPAYSFLLFTGVGAFVLLRVIDAQLIKLEAAKFVENEVKSRCAMA